MRSQSESQEKAIDFSGPQAQFPQNDGQDLDCAHFCLFHFSAHVPHSANMETCTDPRIPEILSIYWSTKSYLSSWIDFKEKSCASSATFMSDDFFFYLGLKNNHDWDKSHIYTKLVSYAMKWNMHFCLWLKKWIEKISLVHYDEHKMIYSFKQYGKSHPKWIENFLICLKHMSVHKYFPGKDMSFKLPCTDKDISNWSGTWKLAIFIVVLWLE